MADLLEAGIEAAHEPVQIVARVGGRFEDDLVRHQDGRCKIGDEHVCGALSGGLRRQQGRRAHLLVNGSALVKDDCRQPCQFEAAHAARSFSGQGQGPCLCIPVCVRMGGSGLGRLAATVAYLHTVHSGQPVDELPAVAISADAGCRTEIGGHLLELRKVIVLFDQEVVDFLGRHDRAGADVRLVEKGCQGLGHAGQPGALGRDDRQETRPFLRLEIGDRLQNFGRGTDGGDAAAHGMHGGAEKRIVIEPVRQCTDRLQAVERCPVQFHERPGPVLVLADQALSAVRIELQPVEQGLDRQGGQIVDQPSLRCAVECVDVDIEFVGQTPERGAADPAPPAFDQVEIRSGDADTSRQRRLRDAERAAPFADAQTNCRSVGHDANRIYPNGGFKKNGPA